eukprot:SAG11_NODE_4241_length_1991_cov_3.223573_1_plen_226_part_00
MSEWGAVTPQRSLQTNESGSPLERLARAEAEAEEAAAQRHDTATHTRQVVEQPLAGTARSPMPLLDEVALLRRMREIEHAGDLALSTQSPSVSTVRQPVSTSTAQLLEGDGHAGWRRALGISAADSASFSAAHSALAAADTTRRLPVCWLLFQQLFWFPQFVGFTLVANILLPRQVGARLLPHLPATERTARQYRHRARPPPPLRRWRSWLGRAARARGWASSTC